MLLANKYILALSLFLPFTVNAEWPKNEHGQPTEEWCLAYKAICDSQQQAASDCIDAYFAGGCDGIWGWTQTCIDLGQSCLAAQDQAQSCRYHLLQAGCNQYF